MSRNELAGFLGSPIKKIHAMTPYKSKSGKNSGVTGFKIGEDYIIVQFNYDHEYKYSYKTAGSTTIENMKTLATKQKGLSTFISKNNPQYDSR